MQWQELRSHIRHLPARDITKIGHAFELGKKMHASQKRRSGEPYFNHPVAVAHMLLDLEADTDTVIAALLHDTVEDTPLTLEEIDKQFDGHVAQLIDGVTKLSSRDVVMGPKLDEQIETLRKIFTLMQRDVRIMVIKLVDRLHNMQTIEFLPPERQMLLAQETREVFVKIADKLCMQDLRDEMESLCLATLEPEAHAALLDMRTANEQRGAAVIDHMRDGLRSHDRILASKANLLFEHKSWDQLRAQMNVGGAVATGVSVVIVTLICEDIDGCYRTLGALHQLWKREVLSFQDFINAPRLNGYRGLHTTIILQDGTRVRCKIRTKDMHAYARKGVSTVCFSGKREIFDILPWTKSISPLSQGTEGQSNDFWESLQSDILGESIIIHGPGDQAIAIPKSATALDGIFALFHEDALKLSSVQVNGKEVPFSTPLSNAVSLNATFSDQQTVDIRWLQHTKTSVAAGYIRAALLKVPESDRITLGRELLQREMTKHRKGFIEEFNLDAWTKKLAEEGYQYPSFDGAFAAIADGRIDAARVFGILFGTHKSLGKNRKKMRFIRYELDLSDMSAMDKVNEAHRQHAVRFNEIRYSRRQKNNRAVIRLRIPMSDTEQADLISDLRAAGALELYVTSHLLEYIAAICLLIGLWGTDAIFAKMLLQNGFSAESLTFVRSWTSLFVAACIVIAVSKNRSVARISLRHPTIWIAGLSFFLLSLMTYLTLQETSPFFYKSTLRVSALILSLQLLLPGRKYRTMIIALALAVCGYYLLIVTGVSLEDIGLSLGCIAVFAVYTWSSESFQKKAHVDVRYPQFFLFVSGISAMASITLLFVKTLYFPSWNLLLLAIGFTVVFVCLPYMLFYALSRVTSYLRLAPLFHASIFITLIAQWLMLGINDVMLIPAALLFVIGSFIAAGRRRLLS